MKKHFQKGSGHTKVLVTANSQPEVLQAQMQKGKLSHGQTVIATLPHVRLAKNQPGVSAQIFFCNMKDIQVTKALKAGDGREIPEAVTLPQGLKVPYAGDGFYNLENVRLTSNGSIQITATADTKWQKVEGLV